MMDIAGFAKKIMDLQIDITTRDGENIGLRNRVEDLTKALLTAEAHVHRQQTAGTHGQDRKDAAAWLEKNRELLSGLKGDG